MSIPQLVLVIYDRLSQALSTAPRGALSVTGLLGLALLFYGYWKLRGNDHRADEERRRNQGARVAPVNQPPVAGAVGTAQQPATTPATSGQAPSSFATATPTGRAVLAQLQGVKRVTLSLPGVVFVESSPAQLQESATVREEAVGVLQEMARVTDLYLLAHVEDDVGEAVVMGALEAAGLLGAGPGQVKPHHVLCCSTLDGKVPLVRQLEPDLHVDGHPSSVDELKRFLPRLLLVRDSLAGVAPNGNVGFAVSLAAYFGL